MIGADLFSVALGEGEHALLRQVDEAGAVRVRLLVLLDQLLQVNCFVGHVLRALLVGLEAQGVAALEHVHGAQSEAEDVVLTRLSRALAVALPVDLLFVGAALVNSRVARLDAGAVVVNGAVGAHRRTHVALSHRETGRALREPLFFALLAVAARLFLAVASPQRERFLAADRGLFKELRAREVFA